MLYKYGKRTLYFLGAFLFYFSFLYSGAFLINNLHSGFYEMIIAHSALSALLAIAPLAIKRGNEFCITDR